MTLAKSLDCLNGGTFGANQICAAQSRRRCSRKGRNLIQQVFAGQPIESQKLHSDSVNASFRSDTQ